MFSKINRLLETETDKRMREFSFSRGFYRYHYLELFIKKRNLIIKLFDFLEDNETAAFEKHFNELFSDFYGTSENIFPPIDVGDNQFNKGEGIYRWDDLLCPYIGTNSSGATHPSWDYSQFVTSFNHEGKWGIDSKNLKNVGDQGYFAQTLLFKAVQNNNLKAVELLLSLNTRGPIKILNLNLGAIEHAALEEFPERSFDFSLKTPLVQAIQQRNLTITQLLLAHGANTEAKSFYKKDYIDPYVRYYNRDSTHLFPLEAAFEFDQPEMFIELIATRGNHNFCEGVSKLYEKFVRSDSQQGLHHYDVDKTYELLAKEGLGRHMRERDLNHGHDSHLHQNKRYYEHADGYDLSLYFRIPTILGLCVNRIIHENQFTIDLSGISITDKGAKIIACAINNRINFALQSKNEALLKNLTQLSLNLSNCKITDSGVYALLKPLEKLPNIQRLNMSANPITFASEFIEKLKLALINTASIQEFDLSYISIRNEVTPLLVEAMINSNSVGMTLCLIETGLNDRNIKKIATLIQKSETNTFAQIKVDRYFSWTSDPNKIENELNCISDDARLALKAAIKESFTNLKTLKFIPLHKTLLKVAAKEKFETIKQDVSFPSGSFSLRAPYVFKGNHFRCGKKSSVAMRRICSIAAKETFINEGEFIAPVHTLITAPTVTLNGKIFFQQAHVFADVLSLSNSDTIINVLIDASLVGHDQVDIKGHLEGPTIKIIRSGAIRLMKNAELNTHELTSIEGKSLRSKKNIIQSENKIAIYVKNDTWINQSAFLAAQHLIFKSNKLDFIKTTLTAEHIALDAKTDIALSDGTLIKAQANILINCHLLHIQNAFINTNRLTLTTTSFCLKKGELTVDDVFKLERCENFFLNGDLNAAHVEFNVADILEFSEQANFYVSKSLHIKCKKLIIRGKCHIPANCVIEASESINIYPTAIISGRIDKLTKDTVMKISANGFWCAGKIDTAGSLYIELNRTCIMGVTESTTLRDIKEGILSQMKARDVSIIAAAFVNLGGIITTEGCMSIAALINLNFGMIYANNCYTGSLVSIDITGFVPNFTAISKLLKAVAMADFDTIQNDLLTADNTMKAVNIGILVAKIVAPVVGKTLDVVKLTCMLGRLLPKIYTQCQRLHKSQNQLQLRDVIPLVLNLKQLVLIGVRLGTISLNLSENFINSDHHLIMPGLEMPAFDQHVALQIAESFAAILGPSVTNEALISLHGPGFSLSSFNQENSLFSFTSLGHIEVALDLAKNNYSAYYHGDTYADKTVLEGRNATLDGKIVSNQTAINMSDDLNIKHDQNLNHAVISTDKLQQNANLNVDKSHTVIKNHRIEEERSFTAQNSYHQAQHTENKGNVSFKNSVAEIDDVDNQHKATLESSDSRISAQHLQNAGITDFKKTQVEIKTNENANNSHMRLDESLLQSDQLINKENAETSINNSVIEVKQTENNGVFNASQSTMQGQSFTNQAQGQTTVGQMEIHEDESINNQGEMTALDSRVETKQLSQNGGRTHFTKTEIQVQNVVNGSNSKTNLNESTLKADKINNQENARFSLENNSHLEAKKTENNGFMQSHQSTMKGAQYDNQEQGETGLVDSDLVEEDSLKNSGETTISHSTVKTQKLELENGSFKVKNNSEIDVQQIEQNKKASLKVDESEVTVKHDYNQGGNTQFNQSHLTVKSQHHGSGTMTATNSNVDEEEMDLSDEGNFTVRDSKTTIQKITIGQNAHFGVNGGEVDTKQVNNNGDLFLQQTEMTIEQNLDTSSTSHTEISQSTLTVHNHMNFNGQANISESELNAATVYFSPTSQTKFYQVIVNGDDICNEGTLDGEGSVWLNAHNNLTLSNSSRVNGLGLTFVLNSDGSMKLGGFVEVDALSVHNNQLDDYLDLITSQGAYGNIHATNLLSFETDNALNVTRSMDTKYSLFLKGSRIDVNAALYSAGTIGLSTTKGDLNLNANVVGQLGLSLDSSVNIYASNHFYYGDQILIKAQGSVWNNQGQFGGRDVFLKVNGSLHNVGGTFSGHNYLQVKVDGSIYNSALISNMMLHSPVSACGLPIQAFTQALWGEPNSFNKTVYPGQFLGGAGVGYDGVGLVVLGKGHLDNYASFFGAQGQVYISAVQGELVTLMRLNT